MDIPPADPTGREAAYDIQVELYAVLGHSKVQVKQLLKLGRGAVVELDRKINEPIDLVVNDKLVGHGEVMVVDDRLGITITDMLKVGEAINRRLSVRHPRKIRIFRLHTAKVSESVARRSEVTQNDATFEGTLRGRADFRCPRPLWSDPAGNRLFVGSIVLSTNDFLIFLQPEGFIMVFGGTLAATFVAFESSYILRTFRLIGSIFFTQKIG